MFEYILVFSVSSSHGWFATKEQVIQKMVGEEGSQEAFTITSEELQFITEGIHSLLSHTTNGVMKSLLLKID